MLMRLLGAFFPNTETGTIVGNAPAKMALAATPLELDRIKSRRLMVLFFDSMEKALQYSLGAAITHIQDTMPSGRKDRNSIIRNPATLLKLAA